ncbi:MAG: nuclear transport factor 2 family protein [Ferruginibacter sp.]
MKKTFAILLAALTIGLAGCEQTKTPNNADLEQEIIALDKLAWKAWKDKNAEWFKTHTTDEFLSINADGVSTKADVIKATPTDCDVKSFSLDNFKFIVLNETAVVLTYTATQDATCSGQKVTPKVRASVTYVKRNGKWLEAFYIDTPINE